ncbi:hypothetical protein [Dysgonomonas massiliensis]|uniref:hypothetical protein n=1 Tax=Dysgonomonas massiliensis TaxID=2040292 RepID=UPI000C78699D|nr:hypothetical protein [Dysgonomonas massiliensis]
MKEEKKILKEIERLYVYLVITLVFFFVVTSLGISKQLDRIEQKQDKIIEQIESTKQKRNE